MSPGGPVSDLRYWLAFNIVQGIGPVKIKALLDHFGDLESAWCAAPIDLARAGLDRRALDNVRAAKSRLDLDEELGKIDKLGVKVLTWEDVDYPEKLRHIAASPPVLYVKGELKPEDEWAVAVVGTRTPTADGREVARQIAAGLARNRVTVVSGLARGVDAQAHRAALDAGGRTLAVLGCGLDIVYPPEHRRLAQRIVGQGALISDYPLGTRPEARNFPPRNRIISGLSQGVLIVEGALDSGARITADFAVDQGREVFAVPGSILNRTSDLTNHLIQNGAKVVMRTEDILEELNLTRVSQQVEVRSVLPVTDEEARLLRILSHEPRHVDEISRLGDMSVAEVSSALTLMELKGLVRNAGGMKYAVVRDNLTEYTTG